MNGTIETVCVLQDCRRAWKEARKASATQDQAVRDFLDFVCSKLYEPSDMRQRPIEGKKARATESAGAQE